MHIFEERYKEMISRCLADDAPFGIVLLEEQSSENSDNSIVLHTTGTLARIEQAEELPDGRYNITVRGESRFAIDEVHQCEPYLTASVRPVWDLTDDPLDLQPLYDSASELFKSYVAALYKGSKLPGLQMPQDAVFLSYAIAATLQIDVAEKQQMLAANSAKSRLELGVELLKRELSSLAYVTPDNLASLSENDNLERTISRVDPSYSHQYFSRS